MGQESLILCDTDIIIEFYKNNPQIISQLKEIGSDNIAVSIITIGELFFGVLDKNELIQINKDVNNLNILHIDSNICETFQKLMIKYVLSHKLAIPDCFIAATALSLDIELFTLNYKDFRFIKGLRLYSVG